MYIVICIYLKGYLPMYLEVFILFCYSITHIAFSCYISLTCLRLAPVQVTTTSFIRCHLSLLMQSFHRAETGHILQKYHLSIHAGKREQARLSTHSLKYHLRALLQPSGQTAPRSQNSRLD